MATATIRIKKGTTEQWTASTRVLDDGEMGLEVTENGHRIIRIGDGESPFMELPVSYDIEEVREIKEGMDKDAQTYYTNMVAKGEEMLEQMEKQATTMQLVDDETGINYRMGISNGTLYFEELEEVSE